MVLEFEKEELENIKKYVGENRFEKGKFDLATKLFNELVFDENFEDFNLKSVSVYLRSKKKEPKKNSVLKRGKTFADITNHL